MIGRIGCQRLGIWCSVIFRVLVPWVCMDNGLESVILLQLVRYTSAGGSSFPKFFPILLVCRCHPVGWQTLSLLHTCFTLSGICELSMCSNAPAVPVYESYLLSLRVPNGSVEITSIALRSPPWLDLPLRNIYVMDDHGPWICSICRCHNPVPSAFLFRDVLQYC